MQPPEGLIETFPQRADARRQPQLLASLEALLLDEAGASVRLASCGQQRARDPQVAANLTLQAHNKVFGAFIRGFGAAYRPVLSAVHQQYDEAVRRGAACALDNLELRRQLLASREARRLAAQDERARVLGAGAPTRQALHARIAEAQQRAARAQGRARRAHKDLAACREESERARQLGRAARAAKQRLGEAAAAEQDWGARVGAAGAMVLEAGPLSPQEEEELEAEMGFAGQALLAAAGGAGGGAGGGSSG